MLDLCYWFRNGERKEERRGLKWVSKIGGEEGGNVERRGESAASHVIWKVESEMERAETSLVHSRMQRKNIKVGSDETQTRCKKESEA